MNRLTRDELLTRALDLIDSAALDQKDRPFGSTIQPQALTIGFLQDGLDFFHRKFPWTGLIKMQSVTFTAGTNLYALPTDYTLDLMNGVRIMQANTSGNPVKRRLLRKSLTWMLGRDSTTDAIGTPQCYCITGTNLRIYPYPDKTYSGGEFWYYALPDKMDADTKPTFPDDWTLIEYVRLRGREWTNEAPPGTAIEFCNTVVSQLQAAGLGNEGENDALELDRGFFHETGAESSHHRWSWMGAPVVNG